MVFTERAEPKIDVQLAQNVSNFQPELFEVVLKVTVTCKQGDKTTYLCEVQQAGVFGIGGFDAQSVDQILGIECPNILFPYLRQAVNQAVTDGGFAPFQLSPINFAALYQQALQQRAAQGGQLPNA
jgi:preprotein translocase subunit SecB